MSRKIKCNNHELVLLIPVTDDEHLELISQITKLLSHIQEFPSCVFSEVET